MLQDAKALFASRMEALGEFAAVKNAIGNESIVSEGGEVVSAMRAAARTRGEVVVLVKLVHKTP
ncbi:hypothetical protein KSX_88550 [Ktedonospora formicarum]|uniref:Uncharacterized protein n=1 Tax=Ktedonospora formicarum TaxID=2778364 RepID=A0A8J3IDE2_9CHLR|nr:hypothetical protein KSX_88550 [Ktedonospora formicarum]